jgi:uncharacterized protein
VIVEQLEFAPAAGGRRYVARFEGNEVAFAEVDPIGDDAILIKHTEVDVGHEGKGYGGALVRFLFEEAKRQNRKVIPICPFAAAWVRRHPEYQAEVRR